MSYRIFLPLFLLSALRLFAAPPMVYTGTFYDSSTGREQIARLAFTASFKSGQKTPVLSAALTLYFGDETSREYIGLYYDPVILLPETREIFLARDDDGRARRLPSIRLKFNAESTEATEIGRAHV